MADGFGFNIHWFLEPWEAMQADLKVASDRATMYGLRATGRAVRAAARAQAPVYSGKDPRPNPGELKRSIKSSRRIRKVGDGIYEMTVMPAGNKKQGTHVTRASGPSRKTGGRQGARGVPLYRRKMEERYGYMNAGMVAGAADAARVFEEAYRKAFVKYAP